MIQRGVARAGHLEEMRGLAGVTSGPVCQIHNLLRRQQRQLLDRQRCTRATPVGSAPRSRRSRRSSSTVAHSGTQWHT
eukprot:643125-Pyramimonas_sp.AAC.1